MGNFGVSTGTCLLSLFVAILRSYMLPKVKLFSEVNSLAFEEYRNAVTGD